MHILKGLALPRASHSGEIALASSRHMCSTVAEAPVLFAHAVVTEPKMSSCVALTPAQAAQQDIPVGRAVPPAAAVDEAAACLPAFLAAACLLALPDAAAAAEAARSVTSPSTDANAVCFAHVKNQRVVCGKRARFVASITWRHIQRQHNQSRWAPKVWTH